MSKVDSDSTVGVIVSLDSVLSQAERQGNTDEYTVLARGIANDLSILLDSSPYLESHSIQMKSIEPEGHSPKDAMQVIQWIVISLTPIGIAGLVELITQMINVCRTRLNTTYEVDLPGKGQFKISGPGADIKDLDELITRYMSEKSPYVDSKILDSHGRSIRIIASPISKD